MKIPMMQLIILLIIQPFCSISYAEISAAVFECEIMLADFRQVAPLYVINLMKIELSDMLCGL